MTDLQSTLENYFPYDWADPVHSEHSPISLSTSPDQFFSPAAGSMPVHRPSERRRALDHFTGRFERIGLPGSDHAIEYLHAKYTHNLAPSTIRQAGGVVLSFLSFLQKNNTDIWNLSRQDIAAYVENDQDRGLKIGAVKTKLRAIYTFIRFLVDLEILPPEILHKKIQIKLPQPLPRAIPSEDIEALLAVIDKVRDRAMILLLLRTGMRIGELLNVKVSDIILSERKILIYLGEKNYWGRVAYFSEDAERALQQWLEARNQEKEFLFYSRSREKISYVAAWTVMKNLLVKAGLAHKGHSLHSLRHTFATDTLNAGLRLEVLQQLLGHRSIEITRRYARMSDTTRETEYFKAMAIIEQGVKHEPHRINTQLQAVFEEKKLVKTHD
jgi:site-specific recombinase XerD